jgi:hypothetical protein
MHQNKAWRVVENFHIGPILLLKLRSALPDFPHPQTGLEDNSR